MDQHLFLDWGEANWRLKRKEEKEGIYQGPGFSKEQQNPSREEGLKKLHFRKDRDRGWIGRERSSWQSVKDNERKARLE